MLTQFCEPETHMTRSLLFARALVEKGHEVQILTGFPNYPNGKIYPGYEIRPLQREMVDGVSILRVPLYPSHDASALRRIVNYASFAISASVLGSIFARRPDVIYVWHPPLTAGVAAMILSITKRAPFVYDIQDLWPDTLAATGMVGNQRLLDQVAALARLIYRRAAHLAVQSPGFRDTLVRRGVPARKIDVIYNWSHEGQLQLAHDPQVASSMRAGERFNVVFAGTMGKAQGLGTVLAAADLLQHSHPNVQFVFVGGGLEVANLRASASERGLGNVLFLPRMPVTSVGSVLGAADVLLIHLKDLPLFEITIPGKTQDYLSTGKPILLAGRGNSAELVEASGGGVVCPPSDPEALANAVVALAGLRPSELEAMGSRGKEYYATHLSLDIGSDRFIDLFRRVIARSAP